MEMVMMAPPWTNFAQPLAIALFVVAHLNFCAGKHENPRGAFVLSGRLDDFMMRPRPA